MFSLFLLEIISLHEFILAQRKERDCVVIDLLFLRVFSFLCLHTAQLQLACNWDVLWGTFAFVLVGYKVVISEFQFVILLCVLFGRKIWPSSHNEPTFLLGLKICNISVFNGMLINGQGSSYLDMKQEPCNSFVPRFLNM